MKYKLFVAAAACQLSLLPTLLLSIQGQHLETASDFLVDDDEYTVAFADTECQQIDFEGLESDLGTPQIQPIKYSLRMGKHKHKNQPYNKKAFKERGKIIGKRNKELKKKEAEDDRLYALEQERLKMIKKNKTESTRKLMPITVKTFSEWRPRS